MNRSSQQQNQNSASAPESNWPDCEAMPVNKMMGARLAQGAKPAFSNEQIGWLVHAVENDIIPRLLRTAKTNTIPHDLTPAQLASASRDIVQIVLENKDHIALEYVRALEQKGLALESIFLNVLAPAANILGVMWENDECDFTQVTLGMWRLHQVMYELSAAFQHQGEHPQTLTMPQSKEAILVPVPGSQHSLGLLMVVEFFRRDGWKVWGDPTVSLAELLKTVTRKHFDLVGISCSTEDQAQLLKHAITSIRSASKNKGIRVMIGGPYILAHPHLIEEVGADCSAPDASLAVQVANEMMAANE